MTTARVALECVALASLLYLACFGVGWWLWRLVTWRRSPISVWTGAPIMGLAVSMVVAYYWAGHGGLDEIAFWLLGVSLAADVVVAWRSRREIHLDIRTVRSTMWVTVTLAGTAAFFSWHRIETFRIGRLSTGSLFLADLPSFASMGDHLGRSGVSGAGSIVGFDLSGLAAETPGSAMFMSLASSWIGRPEYQATLPVLLFCTLLIALASRDLARLLIPWSGFLPAVVAVAAAGVSVLVYSSAHYPLSQLLAMSCAIAFLVVIADEALWARSRLSPKRIICSALFVAPIVLSYPHMAVLGPPALVAIALVAAVGQDWRRRVVVAFVTALVGIGVVVVMVPGAALDTLTRLRQVDEVTAGFPVTLLTPADLLGFRSGFVANRTEPNQVAQFAFESIVMALIIGMLVLWTRGKVRSRVALAGAASLGTLASYALVFLVRGASYEQWKWAAFVVPIFVVGSGAVFVWLCVAVARGRSSATRRLALGFATVTLFVAVISGGVFAHDATRVFAADYQGRTLHKKWELVTDDLIAIGSGPAFRGVQAVNVEVPSFLESSWAAYFLAPRTTFLASSTGILSVPPLARWTLERHDAPFLHPPESDVRVLNASYRLVRERPHRVKPGTLWTVGQCDGVYRFDGRRWQGIERTPETGGFQITITPRPGEAHSREPLLGRAGGNAVDALLLEHLAGGRARIVSQHQGFGLSASDRRLGRYRPFAYGRPFALPAGVPLELSVIFDPITGAERVEAGGRLLFDKRAIFVVRPTLGKTVVGSNQGLAAADPELRGPFGVAPRQTPICDSLPPQK